MRKTKIIVTMGLAIDNEETLRKMILSGMDIARFNMKNLDYDFCEKTIKTINKISSELNKSVSILFDLEGPNVKVGKIANNEAILNTGDKIRIYMSDVLGDSTKFSVNYYSLVNDVKTGTIIRVGNGIVELNVSGKGKDYLLCNVIKGGKISENDNVNIVNTTLDRAFLTEKDRNDIAFANKMDVDFLALSFVSNMEDVLEVNDILISLNNDHISIIPKIENERAIDDIDQILEISDGLLIDRNVLGVELPVERIPGIQKMVINKCHNAGKFSIVATDFLSNESPSRAEVSDVANAVIDGVDVILIPGATIEKQFDKSIEIMSKIIEASEQDFNHYEILDRTIRTENQDITGGVACSVVECSNRINASLIVTLTMSGYTAKKISRFRPKVNIIAITPNKKTFKNLSMYYGVYPVLIEDIKSFDKILKCSKEIAINILNLESGNIIITGGYPFNEVNHTNFMKVEEL